MTSYEVKLFWHDHGELWSEDWTVNAASAHTAVSQVLRGHKKDRSPQAVFDIHVKCLNEPFHFADEVMEVSDE